MCILSFALMGLMFTLTPWQSAAAQGWPERPVTMIVPFPAGAAVDLLARAVANTLSEKFGKQFIVENRVGAGGTMGATAVAKANPDGYTLLFGTPAPIAINKLMYKGLNYDSDKDFAPVVLIAKSPLIVAARKEFPAKNFEELIAYARNNPGKVNVGHPGNGTLGHITSELVQQIADVKMTNVPFRGTAPLMANLIGGQIDIAMDFMPTYVPLVDSNQVRAFAVTTEQRAAELPDVPTVQQGGLKGFEASAWYAMVAPAATPKEIISKLNKEVNEFLQSDKGKTYLAQNALQSVGGSENDLRAFIDSELKKWKPVIETAKIAM